jgi:hypothetical protein
MSSHLCEIVYALEAIYSVIDEREGVVIIVHDDIDGTVVLDEAWLFVLLDEEDWGPWR